MNVNIDIKPGAEDVFAQELVFASFLDGALEDLRALGEFASYIYVRCSGVEGEARDGDCFEQFMRVFVNDVVVCERARLGLARVACEISRRCRGVADNSHAGDRGYGRAAG